MSTVHDFTLPRLNGQHQSLADYKGKVLLLVNVASKCGLTPQYAELQEYYEANRARGIEILGFPANNFGAQEPGSDAEIQEFCSVNYGVTFPMFSKISVGGEDKHPLYQFLTQEIGGEIRWNFQKILVDKNGKVVENIPPTTSITDAELQAKIDSLLA